MSYKAIQHNKVFAALPIDEARNDRERVWWAGGVNVLLICLVLFTVLSNRAYACAMTAVVCKSGYNLGSNDVGFGYGVGATGE